MALIFTDPNSSGPFNTFQNKDVQVRVFKLTSANFSTSGVNTLIASFPQDVSFTRISYWNKTKLAGNSISAATLSLGASSGGTDFVNAYNVFTNAGTYADFSPITGILQPYNVPYTGDIQLWAAGTSTTGTPTSGEIYVIVEYVR